MKYHVKPDVYNIEKNTTTIIEPYNIDLAEVSLLIWDKYFLIGNKKIPLGQWSTDILNIEEGFYKQMLDANDILAPMTIYLFNKPSVKDKKIIKHFQKQLNKCVDIFLALPPYKYLLPKDYGKDILIYMFENHHEEFMRQCDSHTPEEEPLHKFLSQLFATINSTITFIIHVHAMLGYSFNNLEKRDNEHYALAMFSFFINENARQKLRDKLPDIDEFDFNSIAQVGIEFLPIKNPDDLESYILAEKIVFSNMKSILHIDLFRGLVKGNCPRKCENCGKYFLLLSGYNTRYCSNIAPDKKSKAKNKTCRDVGAHNKELEAKERRTPAQVEYDKAYNRLKARKSRKKISDNEWNHLVNKALDLKEQNEKGLLGDSEYLIKMKEI